MAVVPVPFQTEYANVVRILPSFVVMVPLQLLKEIQ
jgi:hypothetical protein